jgi:hypothetical protein
MTDFTPNDLSHLSDEEFNALAPQGYHAPGPATALSPGAQAVLDAYCTLAEQHQDKLDRLIAQDRAASAEARPAPSSSLVERVAGRLSAACGLQGGQWDEAAIDVICEVAAWFATITPRGSEAWRMASEILRQEANR